MENIPIADGAAFRRDVELHSGAGWPMAMRLAEATGILAGRDGARSRGIYCEPCRFGFRREFGPDPMVETRTSLSRDFTDEARRRECPHWPRVSALEDLPRASSGPRAPAVRARLRSPRVGGSIGTDLRPMPKRRQRALSVPRNAGLLPLPGRSARGDRRLPRAQGAHDGRARTDPKSRRPPRPDHGPVPDVPGLRPGDPDSRIQVLPALRDREDRKIPVGAVKASEERGKV